MAIWSTVSNVLIPNDGPTLLAPSSDSRIRLQFSVVDSTFPYAIRPDWANGPTGQMNGILLNNWTIPVVFTKDEHGEIVRSPWYCVWANNHGTYVTVIETFEN